MRWHVNLFVVLLLALAAWIEANHMGFCRSRADGEYALGCVSHFVSCSAHMSFIRRCRRDLYFDAPSSMCLPKWEASSCRDLHYPRPSVILAAQSPAEPGEEIDFCINRADGLYSIGCVSSHILCSSSRAYVMECPGGLVLDTVSKTCLAKSYVAICGGVPIARPPFPVTLPADVIQPAYVIPKPSAQSCIPNHKPAFCCTNKPDGYYSFGCSALYAICIQGRAYLRQCRTHFRFDVVTRRCVQKSYMRECNGYAVQVAPAAITTGTITTSTSLSVCYGRRDGAYTIGCSASYFICISEKAIFNRCIKPMMFDVEVNHCRPSHYVRACGGTPPANYQPSFLPAVRFPSIQQAPMMLMSRPCYRRRNGFFALGCSSRFLSCLDGRPSYYFCPQGRFFDEITLTCTLKSQARPCAYAPPMLY